MAGESSLWSRLQQAALVIGLIGSVAMSAALLEIRGNDVETLSNAVDKSNAKLDAVVGAVNAVKDEVSEMKTGQAVLGEQVKSVANAAASIAATAVTQEAMRQHERAADAKHAAQDQRVEALSAALGLRIDALERRVEHVESNAPKGGKN